MKKMILFILVLTATVSAAERVKVRATGQAPAQLPDARKSAVEDALRAAVEAGAGVEIAGVTEVENYRLIKDAVYARTAGLVEKYEVIEENPNQEGLYTVRVEAIISKADINTQIEAWKALIERKGRPRVLVAGSVDKQPFERRLTAHIQDILEQRGLDVVDLDMLKENQRLDAERAAKGDLDPVKAALISTESGADYFIVVKVEGTKYTGQDYHGITLYPVDASAIVKVIAADTSRIIASKVVSDSQKADTTERAMLDVTETVTTLAVDKAVERVAVNWLDDVDQRGGMEIEVITNGFSFVRLEEMVKKLNQTDGVKEIIIDNTDYQGRSSFRIITNDNAFNIASVLKSIDPGIEIVKSSKYQVEVAEKQTAAPKELFTNRAAMYAGIAAAVLLIIVASVNLLKKR